MSVYISIGNSDDKLTQAEWSEFYELTRELLVNVGLTSAVHGAWASLPNAQWQNACWCVDVKAEHADALKRTLGLLAKKFRQDCVAWAEAPVTEFLGIETPEESAAIVDFNLKRMGWSGLGATDA